MVYGYLSLTGPRPEPRKYKICSRGPLRLDKLLVIKFFVFRIDVDYFASIMNHWKTFGKWNRG